MDRVRKQQTSRNVMAPGDAPITVHPIAPERKSTPTAAAVELQTIHPPPEVHLQDLDSLVNTLQTDLHAGALHAQSARRERHIWGRSVVRGRC